MGEMNVTTDQTYDGLRAALGQVGYLSQGSVVRRRAGQVGSRYLWTRKVKGKTVSVALSQAQYEWLRQAIRNQRECDRLVARLQRHSRKVLFATVPGVAHRKPLSRKVLGLI